MIRELVQKHYIGMSTGFRFRGTEPGRLENFSDAVFALAITLVLISTSAPTNFEQIKNFVWEIIPFMLCITLILLVWYEHFIFYFRYGLRNGKVVVLNTLFLVIVLFYVYPLKFLTKLILIPIAYFIDHQPLINQLTSMIKASQVADLMIIYGLGACCVFFTLMFMYRHAFGLAEELELNLLEKFDTRTSIRTNLLMGLVPLLSVVMAIIFYKSWYAGMISGFTYFSYTPVMLWHGKKVDRERKKMKELMSEENTPSALKAASTHE